MGEDMKIIWNAVLLALILLLPDPAISSGSAMLTVTEADNGKNLTLRTGDFMQIELPEQGSTGYLWQFDDLDGQYFDLIDLSTEKTDKENNFTGGPVLKKWRLQAKKAGKAAIRLSYFRPWEGRSTAIRTFVLNVQIK
jgi:inhibitor of cysteine peptidase